MAISQQYHSIPTAMPKQYHSDPPTIPQEYPSNPTGITQQYHRDITAITSNGTGRFHIKPTGTPHLYGSNLGTPCSNPAANAGIPQQDHSNTQAILQQYYNDNNIAVIPSTHRNATAIPQPSPQSPSISIGNSTSIPQNLTSIPQQYRSKAKAFSQQNHSSVRAIPSSNQRTHTARPQQ